MMNDECSVTKRWPIGGCFVVRHSGFLRAWAFRHSSLIPRARQIAHVLSIDGFRHGPTVRNRPTIPRGHILFSPFIPSNRSRGLTG